MFLTLQRLWFEETAQEIFNVNTFVCRFNAVNTTQPLMLSSCTVLTLLRFQKRIQLKKRRKPFFLRSRDLIFTDSLKSSRFSETCAVEVPLTAAIFSMYRFNNFCQTKHVWCLLANKKKSAFYLFTYKHQPIMRKYCVFLAWHIVSVGRFLRTSEGHLV